MTPCTVRTDDAPCPRCLHRAHDQGQCNTGSTYGCNECGPHYIDCPTCEGEGRVPETSTTPKETTP